MFLASSVDQRPIAETLRAVAREIEERSPRLRVLAAREFRYPVQQQEIRVRVEHRRKMNLLEKFVLRALVEISPTPPPWELADALGLDPVFINSTLDTLRGRKLIVFTSETLDVTTEGKKTLNSESELEDKYRYYFQDTVLGREGFLPRPLDEMDAEVEKLADLNSYIEQDLTLFPAFAINAVTHQAELRELGLDEHDPDHDRFVIDLAPAAPAELRWSRVAVFVLEDSLSENEDSRITFQVRSQGELAPGAGKWLESLLQERHLSLKELCGLTYDTVPMEMEEEDAQNDGSFETLLAEEHSEEIHQQVTQQLRLQVEGQAVGQEAETAIQLRDAEIHPTFLKALEEAREQIIIYSPWMNERVVDDEFLSLLEERVKQGVRILIGYGIERDEKREERPVSPALLQRLRAVQTAEGTPGIIAEWLGNSHAKEIVIDRRVHFNGSQNWLSYRGDRFPRGETVYKVTIVKEVEKAYNHLAQRFTERAKRLWAGTTDEERRLALCILGYLGYEQEALTWIQRDACYRFIPLWLILARQAISAGQETRILAPLRELLALRRSAVELPTPLPAEIDRTLQDILKRMNVSHEDFV